MSTAPVRAMPLPATLQRRLRTAFRLLSALSPRLAAKLALRMFMTPASRRIDPQEAQFLATARAVALRTSGNRIQAYEWPGNGPAVLVVHGWMSHAARMADVINALRARGLRVVAFDAPAHGRSAGRRADLYDFRDAIEAVSAACGPIGGLLAHSFGALTTVTWLAETQPAAVRAVVLVGLPRDVGYTFESFALALALRADVVAHTRELFLRRYGGYPEQYASVTLASQLPMPVLLIHGGADEYVPADHAVEFSEQLIDGKLLVLAAMRHNAPLHDANAVGAMAD
ncbi:MAG TPA: alpha/beta fold hydrolase, partial [Steroidobacteraceae bacterium]|nr:alpha/beta fold hydrolase [Steroidobacteraceae bacterium]